VRSTTRRSIRWSWQRAARPYAAALFGARQRATWRGVPAGGGQKCSYGLQKPLHHTSSVAGLRTLCVPSDDAVLYTTVLYGHSPVATILVVVHSVQIVV
jgi:hypothetical protein